MGRHKDSLQFRTSLLLVIVTAVLVAIVVINNAYAVGLVRRNTYSNISNIMDMYRDELSKATANAETFLGGLQTSNDIISMKNARTDIDYYRNAYLLSSELYSAAQTYSYIDCFFVYVADRNMFYYAVRSGLNTRYDISRQLRAQLLGTEDPAEASANWKGVEISGSPYLLKLAYYNGMYFGCYISVENMLGTMRKGGLDGTDYLAVMDDQGNLLEILPALSNEGETDGQEISQETARKLQSQDIVTLDGEKFLAVKTPSSFDGYSFLALIIDRSITEGLGLLQSLIPILVLVVAGFIVLFSRLQKRWVLRPVQRISSAMKQFEKGEAVQLAPEGEIEEFRQMCDTFNHMTTRIRDLKIDVYEEQVQRKNAELDLQQEKLSSQKIQLQFLQLQINPHFYINCLNIINNLAITGRLGLIQQMTEYLGRHLRYAMRTSTTNPLQEEIQFVSNYMKIQELRFGDAIELNRELEPGVEMVPVPPMVIQTFVENTVKYEIKAGETTEIYLVVTWEDEKERDRILIEMWDTGEGYPADILEKLQSGEKIYRNQREHIGLQNLQSRIRLIYGGKGSIRFSNHPETGGACMEISLPVLDEPDERDGQ